MARGWSLVGRLLPVRGRPRRLIPVRRLLAALVLVLGVTWLVGCVVVVAEPTVDRPAKVDAVLVLGPPDVDGRLAEGYALAAAHYAGTLVISVESEQQRQAKHACTDPNPAYRVICFRPDPQTTRGEAEELGMLARRYHWSSVLVVTSRYHVSRARLLVSRCLHGTVLVAAAPGRQSPAYWAYQFLYQTGGFAKAVLHRDC